MAEADRFHRIKEVFSAALDLAPERRAAFVEEACGGDEALHARVKDLLAADEATGNPLDQSAAGLGARLLVSRVAGRRIGAHRLLREIGRGGMGTIYLAQRDDGEYREEVAIKLIHSGISEAIVRRFRQERQILADLHHPNIARVLDGGLNEAGLPYFVMELIDGQPIDRYCDLHRLSVAHRVELFRAVCGAVQAAHRQLVVHCDLKPSNILVTADGIPKLLDFGIARLLEPSGVAPPSMTGSGRWMTPEYASPEQIHGRPVSTASDVYSLGVVLYRLLTGRRPYDAATESTYAIERAVCESPAEKPSMAIFRQGDERPSAADLADRRDTNPERLRRQLAGDLDNILLRALAKAPEERYGSVEQLAEDLRRHLQGLPVLARQPTLRYRGAKFLRRHRVAVAATLVVLLSLVGGILSTAHQARVARQQERSAQRTLDYLTDLFERSNPDDSRFGTLTLRDVLDDGARRIPDLSDQPLAQARLQDTIGEVYRKLGDYGRAEELLTAALDTRRRRLPQVHRDLASSLHHLGGLRHDQARYDEAEELLRQGLVIRQGLADSATDPAASQSVQLEVANSLNNLGRVMRRQKKLADAEDFHRRALEVRRSLLGEESIEASTSLHNLAGILRLRGDPGSAEELYHRALTIRRRFLGDEHPRVAASASNLASLLTAEKRYEEAEALYRETLEHQHQLLGRHPKVAVMLNNLGLLLRKMQRLNEAEEALRDALAIFGETQGEQHPDTVGARDALAMVLWRGGKPDEATPLFRQSLDEHRQAGAAPTVIARARRRLGASLGDLGRFEAAESHLLASLQVFAAHQGVDGVDTARLHRDLVALYEAWGKGDLAERYRAP
ncbi:MAG: tetratricopeptide repeat protein [Acidobacteriota bacterium]